MNERKNTHDTLLKLCFSGMFAALICVATILIRIPAPVGGGYLNLGDCFILIAAWTVGPYYGFAAGAVGSALADILAGAPIYAPGTFVIKGLIAFTAALIFRALSKKSVKMRVPGLIIGAVSGEIVMIMGYFLYDALILGFGFAPTLLNMPLNLVQGALGAVIGVALMPIILKTGLQKRFPVYSAR